MLAAAIASEPVAIIGSPNRIIRRSPRESFKQSSCSSLLQRAPDYGPGAQSLSAQLGAPFFSIAKPSPQLIHRLAIARLRRELFRPDPEQSLRRRHQPFAGHLQTPRQGSDRKILPATSTTPLLILLTRQVWSLEVSLPASKQLPHQ